MTEPDPNKPIVEQEADKYRLMLLDLLAVIHRDGGHKTQEIGIKLAYEQAMRLSSERIAKVNEAKRMAEKLAMAERALQAIEPHLDAIVCYASTMGEHEPNRIAAEVRTALSVIRADAITSNN